MDFVGTIRGDMREQVEEALEWIRPRLALHKGNIELVDIDEERGIVRVRFLGTCKGCALSQLTLKAGVESVMMEMCKEVREVIAVD